jgi:hypothetical protein
MGIVYLTTNKINNKKYIGVDSKNDKNYFGSGKAIKLALKKYGTKNFTKEILEENYDINYLFEREKYYINKFDAINSNEFYNIAEGGKGGAGTLITEESKEKHRIGILNAAKTIIEQRKGKNYKEIYGGKADEEKEKRSIAGLGKKYSDERVKKVSSTQKGKIPWNKDKKGLQTSWNKGLNINNNIYILTTDNIQIKFNGRAELEKYVKDINTNKVKGTKININKLIKNKENGYNINIISTRSFK